MINRYFALTILKKAHPDQDPSKWRQMSNYQLNRLFYDKKTKKNND